MRLACINGFVVKYLTCLKEISTTARPWTHDSAHDHEPPHRHRRGARRSRRRDGDGRSGPPRDRTADGSEHNWECRPLLATLTMLLLTLLDIFWTARIVRAMCIEGHTRGHTDTRTIHNTDEPHKHLLSLSHNHPDPQTHTH